MTACPVSNGLLMLIYTLMIVAPPARCSGFGHTDNIGGATENCNQRVKW